MRILFVCLGNICRSPSAEAVMRGLIASEGIEGVEIDSAGTGDWHVGNPADPRAIAAATERGVEINGRARQVRPSDFGEYDLILAMDRSNHADLLAMEGVDPGKVRLFREMAGEGELDVPDPYYGGEGGFSDVLDILENGCAVILEEVRP
ncbi:MAG: low molecular weight phosphotyrosine protein phosphatase [Thermoleophilales bacterium]|nr:low molecular weight phosphotyrosine protein phosphatase [Thermoleophilales bacterium]